jgi:hypothetical protein
MKNVSKIASEILKESIDISKGKFYSYLYDAQISLKRLLKIKHDIATTETLFNTVKMYIDKANSNFPRS